jgi:hypothetical protein
MKSAAEKAQIKFNPEGLFERQPSYKSKGARNEPQKLIEEISNHDMHCCTGLGHGACRSGCAGYDANQGELSALQADRHGDVRRSQQHR